jgi:hypothetical protein
VSSSTWPALRVVFRNHCYYREDAPNPSEEWRSSALWKQSTDRDMAAKLKFELMDPGYITIPTALFPNLTGAQIPPFTTLFTTFFERCCLPEQPMMEILDFLDPETGTLDLLRLGWLCSYVHIDPCFDISFATPAADWHVVYHSLSTFAEMRVFM